VTTPAPAVPNAPATAVPNAPATAVPNAPAPAVPQANPNAASPADAALAQERARVLATQLRCLVCQNQTIADSNAGLAVDLRNQVAEQIRAGRSDSEIKQYMVERYGEFVLYDPPLTANNIGLWVAPFLLLFCGLVMVWLAVRRHQRAATHVQTAKPERSERLDALESRYRNTGPLE